MPRLIRLCLCSALLACGGAPDDGGGRVLRFNLRTEPPTLDWNLAADSASFTLIEQLMRGLTRLDHDLRLQPALARSWEASEGGRVWRFHLRRDVVWSDGEPLHARQFVDGWRRLLDPRTASEYAYFLFAVRGARAFNAGEVDATRLGVSAPDAHTLEVELEEALVYFPALVSFMATYPIRRELIERHGNRWTDPENWVGLGPFRLKEWRHEYRIALDANPFYFAGRPWLDRVVAYMIDDFATELVLFEQGRLDLVELAPLEIPRYAGRPEYRRQPLLVGYYYGFNTRRAPFDDVRVRRAFAQAIDRERFPQLLRGGEKPSASWLPPGLLASNPGIGLAFDPARARALLAEAGVDPERLEPVVVGYNTNDPRHKLVGEAVQAMWSENLGVEVELQPREWKVYLKQLTVDPPAVFRLGWVADFPDPHNFMELFTSSSANNHTGWADAGYDALVERAAREPDPDERVRLYDEAQRILCERDVPIVPFFVSSLNLAVAPRVRGLKPNALNAYSFEEVSLD